jgi:hypothetical protein
MNTASPSFCSNVHASTPKIKTTEHMNFLEKKGRHITSLFDLTSQEQECKKSSIANT